MNDFTKDELEELLKWRSNILYTSKPSKETMAKNVNLGNKIASMIIDYCPHKGAYTYEKTKLCLECGKINE